MPGLIVHVKDLFLALLVESTELLARRSVDGLFKVRVQSLPTFIGSLRDGVLLVNGLRALSGLELGVELLQGAREALADAVLLIQS